MSKVRIELCRIRAIAKKTVVEKNLVQNFISSLVRNGLLLKPYKNFDNKIDTKSKRIH